MATVTKPIILDETGQAMVTALQTIATHAAGLVGQGVPASGTTGQVLAKKSNTDYDTEWITPSGSTTEVFWATYGTTTSAEIEAAYQAGKIILYVNSSGYVYTMTERVSATKHIFVCPRSTTVWSLTVTSDSWGSAGQRTLLQTSTSNPSALGTADPGSGSSVSKYDHVHPMPSASDVGAIEAPTSPISGDFLRYNGSDWVAADGAGYLQEPLSANDGDVLTYDTLNGWGAEAPAKEVFWATYNTTTSAQIEAAYQAGKLCCVEYNNRIYLLEYRTSATKHGFRVVDVASQEGVIYSINCISDVWSTSTLTLAKSSDIPSASSATPQALGTAAAGSSGDFSRADHVHPMPSASNVGAVAVAQGVGHAGEFLVVGSNGNVTTVTLSTWQGGSY